MRLVDAKDSTRNPQRRLRPLFFAFIVLLSLLCFELWMIDYVHGESKRLAQAAEDKPHRNVAVGQQSQQINSNPEIRKAPLANDLAQVRQREATTAQQPHRLEVKPVESKPATKKTSKNVKKPPPPHYEPSDFADCKLLEPDDSIYQYGPWDDAPVVLKRYKLLFFTLPKVGCTVFKQLLRRIEGYEDWQDTEHPLPHAPRRNGLEYLYDFSPAEADQMLTDPTWTRAIFVREPKERMLSAYLDKGTQIQYMQYHCCASVRTNPLRESVLQCDHPQKHQGPTVSQNDKPPLFLSFPDFLNVTFLCPDQHWKLQADRMEAKYWQTINFLGRMEHVEADTKHMLQQIGAWDDYGNSGWPNGAIFAGDATVSHATGSKGKVDQYFTPRVASLAKKALDRDQAVIDGIARRLELEKPAAVFE